MRVRRRNLSQEVAEALLVEIRDGRLRPGERLTGERTMMASYGVGRNTIREAIQSLVTMRVLDVRPGRGAVVLGIPSEQAMGSETVSALLEDQAVSDLTEFRELIELEIAARAAERASPEDIQAISDALEEFRRELESGRLVYRVDIEFHRTIARATQNEVFVRVLDALSDRLLAARRETELVPGTKERALDEHEAVLSAIRQHDAAAARAAMAGHLATAEAALERRHRLSRRTAAAALSPQISAEER